MPRIGSILHGAYGDYYEQLLCLKDYKRKNPGDEIVLFFASDSRLRAMRVFDLSFAGEIHSAQEIATVPVDTFRQFQVRDAELQREILSRLPEETLAKIDLNVNRKPWNCLREINLRDSASDLELSELGRSLLPGCMEQNQVDAGLFSDRLTVGFLWRHRKPGEYLRTYGQTPEQTVLETKSDLFQRLIKRYCAHILIAGMNFSGDRESIERTDNKYTEKSLNLDPEHCTYLKGLSWGLELEIMRRCSICYVMPSGFSEALWIKRNGPTILVDAEPDYLLRLLYNRMPFYNLFDASRLLFALRQPHTADRVLAFTRKHYPQLLQNSQGQHDCRVS